MTKVREKTAESSPTESPSATIIPDQAKTSPTTSKTSMSESEYDGYPYSYKNEGDTTIAMFVKRVLPRDDKVFVGAVRHVIRQAYNEETSGTPYLVDTNSGAKAIRIDSEKHGYVVLPVKEDTGEINSLRIEQVDR